MNDKWNYIKSKIFGFKDLAFVGIGDIIGTGVSAIFWFYIAAMLSPEKYGEIHHFLGIAGISSSISLFATQNTITVYTAKNVKIQSALYLISLIVGIISSLIVILIFYRIDTGALILAYIINMLALGDILGKKLFSQYSKFVLTQKVLTLVLGIGFYYVFGSDGIIYALALSYIAYTIRIYKGFRENKIDFSLMKSRLGFIVNNYMVGLVGGFAGQIDKLIIVPLLGFSPLGNYNLASQVIAVLMTFSTILFKYILPHDASGNQNILLKKFIILVSVGITVFGITLLPLIMPIVFPKYVEASTAVQIMSFGIVPGTVDMMYTSRLLGNEKSKFVLTAGLISLSIMVVGMIVLGSAFSTIGVAITFVLAISAKATYLICINRFVK